MTNQSPPKDPNDPDDPYIDLGNLLNKINQNPSSYDYLDGWHSDTVPKIGKCTCGVTKVYGPNYPKDKHSDWCDI